MRGAVDAANRVVALFSSAYFEDLRYTTDEWTSALLKNDEGRHRLVPVQVEPCTVPQLLRPLTRVELFDVDEGEAARRLSAAARGPARPDGKPVFPGSGRAAALTSRGEVGPRSRGYCRRCGTSAPVTPGFVGRDATLVHLRERLRSGGTAVVQVLHGVGGVGKTQVAIEYAHRYAGAYEVVWWVRAEEAGLIGEQFAALAVELGLTPPHADKASAVGAVRAYLRGQGRWPLLLDNAESPGDLRAWLSAGSGHTLITSRNPGWGELAARVEVDVLPRPESVELIHVTRPGAGEVEADHLAEALGDLPLALTQAAGFLAETGMSVEHYLSLLETRAEELLDQSAPLSHTHSLAAVIRVATDRLAKVDQVALALVRIAAFLAPEPIPADVLIRPIAATGHSRLPELEALTAAVVSPVAAHRSLGRLSSYGLARVDRGLQLHRLTQAVLRDQLPADSAAAYRAYAEALLVEADPGDGWDPARWLGWARILPHLLAADPATSLSSDLRELACRAAGICTAAVTSARPGTSPSTFTGSGANSSDQTTGTPCAALIPTSASSSMSAPTARLASSARTLSLGVSECWVTTIPRRCTQRITSRPACIAWAPSSRPVSSASTLWLAGAGCSAATTSTSSARPVGSPRTCVNWARSRLPDNCMRTSSPTDNDYSATTIRPPLTRLIDSAATCTLSARLTQRDGYTRTASSGRGGYLARTISAQ
jgi:hypothetical protein